VRVEHLKKVVNVVERPAAQHIGEVIVQHLDSETREVSREMCSRYSASWRGC
jgi:hypothetical protein